jgi:hypothetical protein
LFDEVLARPIERCVRLPGIAETCSIVVILLIL